VITLNNKKILIIGGTGFVGKTLRKYWTNANLYYTNRNASNDPKSLRLLDSKSYIDLFDLYDKHKFDIVINCAANSNPILNKSEPIKTFLQDFVTTKNLTDLQKLFNFQLIYFSSGIINHSCDLESGYLEGKRSSEFLCRELIKEGRNIKIVRLYSVVGEHLNLDSGLGICKFIKSGIEKNNIEVTKANIIRSYLFEDDLANAIEYFINSDLRLSDIGSNDLISIQEIAEIVSKEFKINFTFNEKEYIRNGVDEMIPRPLFKTNTISSKEAIQKTLNFFKNG